MIWRWHRERASSEARLRALFENGIDLVSETDAEGRYVLLSPNHRDILGWDPAERVGRSCLERVHPEDVRGAREGLKKAIQSGQPTYASCRLQHTDGSWRLLEITWRPYAAPDRSMRAVFVARDVTESERQRRELREREHYLNGVLASLHGTFAVLFDRDGSVLDLFGNFADRFQGMRGQIEGGALDSVLTRAQQEHGLRVCKEIFDGAESRSFEDRYDLGEVEVWLATNCSPVRDADGRVTAVLAVSHDVTVRRRMEQALRESEQRFSQAFHASPVAMVISRISDGQVLDANAAALDLLDCDRDELVGRNRTGLADFIDEGERNRIRQLVSQEGAIRQQEVVFHLRDGEDRRGLVSATRANIRDDPCAIWSVVDITELRRADAERARLIERVQKLEKLESLGMLAGGIAHDFNNLLVAVGSNAQLVRQELDASSPVAELVEEIELATQRGIELVNELFAYSGRGELRFETIEVPELVRENADLVRGRLGAGCQLKLQLSPNTPRVRGDPVHLGRVITNLLANAADAADPGSITLRSGGCRCDEEELSGYLLGDSIRPGRFAWLEVVDDGDGMDPEISSRIFDPFFTSKEHGRGLGLATVLGIVRRHAGALRFESRPGLGTTFRVLLPADVSGEAAGTGRGEAADDGNAAQGDLRTILLVDDETAVSRVAARMLRHAGYAVVTATSGPEALEILRARPDRFAAAILDARMPGMDGKQVFEALRRLCPELPVLFATGYGVSSLRHPLGSDARVAAMAKPFTEAELCERLEALLS